MTTLRTKITFSDSELRDAFHYWFKNQFETAFLRQKNSSIETSTEDDEINSKYSFTAVTPLPDAESVDEVLAYMTLPGGLDDSGLIPEDSTMWTQEEGEDEEVYHQWEAP